MTIASDTMQLRPLGEALGTEAFGVDLSKPTDEARSRGSGRLSPSTRCWCSAISIWTPAISPRSAAASAPRANTPSSSTAHPEYPEVSWLTNVEEDGKVDWYGVKRATDWHTDLTYEEKLPLLAMLHALEVPATKGGTMFADMRAAYDALCRRCARQRLAGLTGIARPQLGPAGRTAVRRR